MDITQFISLLTKIKANWSQMGDDVDAYKKYVDTYDAVDFKFYVRYPSGVGTSLSLAIEFEYINIVKYILEHTKICHIGAYDGRANMPLTGVLVSCAWHRNDIGTNNVGLQINRLIEKHFYDNKKYYVGEILKHESYMIQDVINDHGAYNVIIDNNIDKLVVGCKYDNGKIVIQTENRNYEDDIGNLNVDNFDSIRKYYDSSYHSFFVRAVTDKFQPSNYFKIIEIYSNKLNISIADATTKLISQYSRAFFNINISNYEILKHILSVDSRNHNIARGVIKYWRLHYNNNVSHIDSNNIILILNSISDDLSGWRRYDAENWNDFLDRNNISRDEVDKINSFIIGVPNDDVDNIILYLWRKSINIKDYALFKYITDTFKPKITEDILLLSVKSNGYYDYDYLELISNKYCNDETFKELIKIPHIVDLAKLQKQSARIFGINWVKKK